MAAHDEERRPATPEDMAEAGRAMMEKRGDEPLQEPSVEAALQLRHKTEEKAAAKRRFLDCNSLSDLPTRARDFAEASEAAKAALRVVMNESGVLEQPIEYVPSSAIVSRG